MRTLVPFLLELLALTLIPMDRDHSMTFKSINVVLQTKRMKGKGFLIPAKNEEKDVKTQHMATWPGWVEGDQGNAWYHQAQVGGGNLQAYQILFGLGE